MTEGDIRLGDTLDLDFTTSVGGVPTQLAGSPSVAAYVGNSTTEITAGITLTVDFDGRTGLNHVRVVATSGNGFATATNIRLVITAGTVGGQSVVGSVIGSFSIENRSALIPTTAARTLDVSAGGEAGVDWANVGSPTTVVGLSGTSVKTATDVETDTQDLQSRTPAALVGGRTDASVGAMAASVLTATAIATDAITAAKIAADAIGASELAADAVTEIQSGLATASALATVQSDTDDIQARLPAALTGGGNIKADAQVVSDKTGYALSGAGVQAIWDALTSALTTVGSIGKRIVDFLTGDAYVRIGAAGASLTDLGGMSTTMKAQVQQEAEDALAVTIADSVPADGTRPTPNQALYAIYQFLMERAVSGTTLTVKKPDGSTTLMTFTLSDPTSPISITRTS